jgi:membrane peptidoglycan carboxypeptidase
MEGVVHYGTAAGAHIPEVIPDARGKTGTTSQNTDLWFSGYADGLLGVGWCANEQKIGGVYARKPMSGRAFGGNVTALIWRDVMKVALKLRPQEPIVSPVVDPDADANKVAAGKFGDKPDDGSDMPSPDDPSNPANQHPVAIPKQNPDSIPPADPNDSTPDNPTSTPPTPVDKQPNSLPPSSPTKHSEDEEYVEVEVCEDTGLKATMYCPDTVAKRFKKGTEPKKYCTLHTGNRP